MPFVPRSYGEIVSEAVARFVARSGVTDVEEGSVPASILLTSADEVEAIEGRQKAINDSFTFERATGTDLDDRGAEFPGANIPRLGPSAAVSTSMELTVIDTANSTTVPAGTVYGRSDDGSVTYLQSNDVTIPAGQAVYPAVGDPLVVVVASLLGTRGNAPAAVVSRVVEGPYNLLSVTNTAAITGGVDYEPDASYRQRLRLYLSSLAGSQPAALEFFALGFRASSGVQIRYAKIVEDPTRPGYSELVIDDGAAMQGEGGKGIAVQGRVPVGDPTLIQTVIYHEGPATEPIPFGHFYRRPNDVGAWIAVPLALDGVTPQWVSIPERGVLYPDVGVLIAGDGWLIDDYLVYKHTIRELQAQIEGSAADPFNTPGKRAAGTRVRVVAPIQQQASPGGWDINVVVFAEADTTQVQADVKAEVVSFCEALDPGAPMLLAALSAKLMALEGVRNILISLPTADCYPATYRHKLVTTATQVRIY